MSFIDSTQSLCLLLLLAAGAWFDAKERRVPNVLTIGGIATALLLAAAAGSGGIGSALFGAAIALAVSLPVFLAGGLGGGDVKLLVAVGAFLGPAELPIALIAIALVGGLMAAFEIVRVGAVRRTAANLWLIVSGLNRSTFTRWKDPTSQRELTVYAPEAVTLPFAVAIALGVLLAELVVFKEMIP